MTVNELWLEFEEDRHERLSGDPSTRPEKESSKFRPCPFRPPPPIHQESDIEGEESRQEKTATNKEEQNPHLFPPGSHH
ncbi:hypothetical protein [Streptomyces malaysiense]|uniref:hypothetical protein n=1 Tax=Streptomyces malaysiense TaxID=1428626 RepID=UPI001160D8C1|nr:hypothetical protein [Streptomyces malaysiense]